MTDRYGHPRQSVFNRRHVSATASVSYSSTTSTSQQHASHLPPPGNPNVPALPGQQPSTATGRRKMFTSQLTRRPPPGRHGGALGRGMSVDGLGGDDDEDGETMVVEDDDDDEIVVRDHNGEVALDEPPNLVVDHPDETVLDMRQENERERQRLADAVKQHQSEQNSVPAQPEGSQGKSTRQSGSPSGR
ncbi:hypothetical protein M406DRAFT_334940 [Cryphonectria parasitica EP155]|uniref:Uncharacterized protein n=1 Tax=Cryphonectria parasitica (strain ATCC 38755 / EP155) TaxID=660469 RepID=A0A9P5CJL9_CRYP1|nr:uncharacterized protein M406DRAFT_334940 [Cryphonectria parasitica EP155]KAF3760262.1 hypothetical protein M406DRAFT_334940 [Cryphonectria parasitica EP155]